MTIPVDFPIIDAHQHFWDPDRNYHPWLCDEPMIPFRYGDYSSIKQRFLPPDYLEMAKPLNVTKTVYVETEWDPADPVGETLYIHRIARQYGYPNAVVAQAWLDREDVAEVLKAQAAFPLVRSVRHKPAAAGNPDESVRGRAGGMDDMRWRDGFALLSKHQLMFDLQAPWWEFAAAADLAADFPRTKVIINHAGLPADRSDAALDAWRQALSLVARHSNVFLKISGIGLAGRRWTLADNLPVIRDAISIFGPERCMFASNYPVDRLVASFSTLFNGFYAATESLSEAARRALFHDTAAKLYRPQTLHFATSDHSTKGGTLL